ncbi:hypothetical protein PPERSA_05152 [Pseudocohnilembus persalinus]|uniref:Cyclic nucleotide-binding protein n=1 Tax=Pseudocohnilembus persalinus TaxID=266149 RepID=A0A0V0R986_PSEPJ|nr:hypothetical protein PPERSA_05152 [Pseudocohnilembus persalinus]|eukprot:KRX11043.1 hypothetical protein PPERSA_05152 [Pseudocohnilembus persalinus]
MKVSTTYFDFGIEVKSSFYWAIATIMLIGTQGQTDIETVFAVLCLLVTVGYFAKILGQVSMVMDQMEQQKKAYKQEKEIMNSFFNIHSDFQPDLQSQLHSYLKYSYCKAQLYIKLYINLFKKYKIFRGAQKKENINLI